MAFIAGHFIGHFSLGDLSAGANYYNIGGTREGFTEEVAVHHQPVISDRGGESQVDGIQQGSDMTLRLDYIEYDKIKPFLFIQEPEGRVYNNVGLTLTSLAGVLVLTPIAGTSAAADIGAGNSRMYYRAIIESNIPVLLASKLRQGPCTFRCFPEPLQGLAYTDAVMDIVTTPSFSNG
jgi:hypothetical protein